jgi:acylphosphatase
MVQKRIHIFVTGRVQGVFFRQSTKVMAIKNNVKGWVRNLDDGRVEIIGEGEIQDIENLTQWCKTGPANSRVDEFETHGFTKNYSMHSYIFYHFLIK